MLPTAETMPVVTTLAAITLPVAEINPVLLRLVARTLPDAVIVPDAMKFPPVTLAVTAKALRVPTDVRLDVVTLLLRVLPVISAAGAELTTPVS